MNCWPQLPSAPLQELSSLIKRFNWDPCHYHSRSRYREAWAFSQAGALPMTLSPEICGFQSSQPACELCSYWSSRWGVSDNAYRLGFSCGHFPHRGRPNFPHSPKVTFRSPWEESRPRGSSSASAHGSSLFFSLCSLCSLHSKKP